MRNSYPIYLCAIEQDIPYSLRDHQEAIERLYVVFTETLSDEFYKLEDYSQWSDVLDQTQQHMLGHHMAIDWLSAHPVPF